METNMFSAQGVTKTCPMGLLASESFGACVCHATMNQEKIKKGGSFMCHKSYCRSDNVRWACLREVAQQVGSYMY